MPLNCGVGEDSWESLVLQEIKPVNPKGNQSWIFIGRTDAEAETPIFWASDVKNWLLWKDPDAGKDWRQEEKGTTEDEMVGWHHRLDGHESEQAGGVGDAISTISFSVTPFTSCPQSFPASGSFLMSQFFASGGQSIGTSASASVLPMSIQDWFSLRLTGFISLPSKGLSRVFSNTTVQRHQFFGAQLSL